MISSQLIKEINAELTVSPLSAIDKFIVNSKNIHDEQFDEKTSLNFFCKCIVEHLKININGDKFIDEVFSDNIGIVHQEFIGVCFLRLFNNNKKMISSYKIKILNLFDKTLKDVYK